MRTRWNGNERSDGLGRDMQLARALELLDPAGRDATYWFRFRSWVVESAAAELARRRLMTRLTVGDVLNSWARTVVPTAVLAAAVAGMLLARAEALVAPQPIGVEELLLTEIEGLPIPVALDPQNAIVSALENF
jgi:hypothetical protein